MPRYPDDALEVAMSDDYRVRTDRTGKPSQDTSPAPKKPGFLGRLYDAIVGNKHVDTVTPYKRSDQIPTLTDTPEYSYRMPRPKVKTIEAIEAENPGATPEELDALILENVRESRQDRAKAWADKEDMEDMEDDVPSESDTEEDRLNAPKAMAGGGHLVLGSAALAALILAMSVLQS